MYVTDPRGSVYAVNAADGHLLWTYDVTNLIGGGGREGYIFRNRGVVLCRRRDLHGGGIVPVRARRQDREADAGLRQERPGQRDPGRHQAAISRR